MMTTLQNRDAAATALLMLLAATSWAWLASIAGQQHPAVICGLQAAAAHDHCWRCYALAAAALGLTLGALNRLAWLALSQNHGD